jgi:hypothetical protein
MINNNLERVWVFPTYEFRTGVQIQCWLDNDINPKYKLKALSKFR